MNETVGQFIDGRGFYLAFLAGAETLVKRRDHLNKINVFPVADSDTGTNMVTTIRTIVDGTKYSKSLKQTMQSMADSGLSGARGNSGIIFAEYLLGVSLELDEGLKITARNFSESAKSAVKYIYDSLVDPVEGTMLTVIRDWADALVKHSEKTKDIPEIFQAAYDEAVNSLNQTPQKLKVLAEAGVVDAGAKGFVYILEGILEFIKKGKWHRDSIRALKIDEHEIFSGHTPFETKFRYCAEAIITKPKLDLQGFKDKFNQYGDSFIVAGTKDKIHLHIHTDDAADFFKEVKDYGEIGSIKVDDMMMQYAMNHKKKYPIGILTDSACDLPQHIIEDYQIQQISFGINFGESIFLDKKTIEAKHFYDMLKQGNVHPVSSQPSPRQVESILDIMSKQYQKVYSVHISAELTGIYQTAERISQNYDNIRVVNTRHLSVSEGLIVLRLAEAISSGMEVEEIDNSLDQWVAKTTILTDVDTLKYLVRGGRVSPFKGYLASALNLKPILSVDCRGKAMAYGKSFSRSRNMNKILQIVKKRLDHAEIRNYAIVHADASERAHRYAEKLTAIIGKEPAYLMELSPVVGVHNGIGAVGIGIMEE
jgi:uncharacterized protein